MPGLSFRALLCCSARVGDNDDLELPKMPPSSLISKTEPDGGTAARGVEDTTRATSQGVDAISLVNQLHAHSQSEGEKESLDQGSKARSWNIALEGGVLILTLTKGILGNFSFPGTDVAFDVALAIVRNVKTSRDNAEKLDVLRTRMNDLQSAIPSDLSDVHPESQEMFLRFKSKIEEAIVPLAQMDKKAGVVKIFLANLDKQKLDKLSDGILNAVELLSVQTVRYVQQAHKRQEDSLHDIGRKVDAEKLEKAVNKLPRTAAYDSQRTRPIDVCYEGTCEAILSKAKTWASAEADERPRMFWLSGLAGTGKSTIAKTIATWADREGRLGGSYFFSRDVEELSKSSLVIPMLAYHLSKSKIDPSFTKRVSEALVEDDSRVLYQEITVQFRKLIQEPLQSMHVPSTPRNRMLIVVDALDECSDRSDAGKIIKLLLQQLSESHSHLSVFLISRPEPHILDALQLENQLHPTVTRFKVEDFVRTSDIEIYLRHGLANLGPTGWPNIDEFNALVEKSGRLFIYASTAIKYITRGRALANPVQRLKTLLSMNPGEASEDAPYKQLDDLYLRIFIEAVDDDKQVNSQAMVRFRRIVGTLVRLRNPLSTNSLASLLEEDEQVIWTTLDYLGSIIIVPPRNDRDTPPRFFHPSLPDFLTDANRCADKRFFIDVPQLEGYVSQCCLRVMIAKLPDMSKVKRSSLSVLRYACTHWAAHLEITHHDYIEIAEDLLTFIRYHLRDWLNARKLLPLERFIYRSVWSMEVAQVWLAKSNRDDKLENIFGRNFQSLLDEVLPQVHGASYDSVKSMRRIESCHPGTRTAILEQTKDWATKLHPKSPSIFWLCEFGGTGKSAVAASIAEWATEDSFLGGSFFFDQQAPQVDMESIILTIAHDLASFNISMRSSITQALDNVGTYFEDLIAVSLTKLTSRNPILLVIDALDECDNQTATEIINLIFTLPDYNPHVRILLTSRPEPYLCAAFARENKQNFINYSVNPEDSEYGESHEIETYLCTGLSKISGEVEWRGRDDFRTLVEYCGNLFVHATTALRYINLQNGDIETLYSSTTQVQWTKHPTNDSIGFTWEYSVNILGMKPSAIQRR
ncbi:hypothetical protein SCHPADRAFT_508578 [Schizopora paradoxa]|uniref:Nephrocystin 3-like N-terminal domain-containing protein n=1 Tax=Schizopora paradoxa TaxID=27342 RepID=A0A0H2RME0_9AGAM|nr:hypothetical protein SCHPADRAFT_508578 [Schizopora paradoxa]